MASKWCDLQCVYLLKCLWLRIKHLTDLAEFTQSYCLQANTCVVLKGKNKITFDKFTMKGLWRHFPLTTASLTVSDSISFHPKHRTVSFRFQSTCTQAETATEEWRLHKEVKWQIQVARRNINSFRPSEQQASCQKDKGRSKGLTPDMTDALELRENS